MSSDGGSDVELTQVGHGKRRRDSDRGTNGVDHTGVDGQKGSRRASPRKAVYDPEQDPEQKRRIRREYREAIDVYEKMKKDVNGVTTHELSQHVKRTNRLYDQVRAPQEAALDSKALALVAEMGAIKSRQMKIEADAFDVDDYIDRLKALLGHSTPTAFVDSDDDDDHQPMQSTATFDWKKVANLAIRYSRRTPALLFMYGPLALEAKKRTVVRHQRLVKDVRERKRPEAIVEGDITKAENETTANVRMIDTLLKAHGGETGIGYFKFIINPDSFGQTVENLFYLSFLVKDGLASIDDADGELILMATEKPSEEDRKLLGRRQLVLSLDMELWQQAIKAYHITESVIPTRSAQSHVASIGKHRT